MKRRRRALLLIVLGALLPATALGAAAAEGELIDRVWAGHPVGFALLVERGHQFIAYYDAERRLTVAGRRGESGPWTRVHPEGVPLPARKRSSNVTGWDSHNYLRLALDRDGCLHLAGNMHVDPLVYYRTAVPFDVSRLERLDRMTGERELRCTYPVFFRDAAGRLLFRYRDGSSGNGSDLYNIYDPDTRAWRRLLDTPLLEGEGQRNAYALEPRLGPDGWFHLVWMWRETPDCATNHSLSYARSRDFQHWEDSRGRPVALPVTLATGDVIDAAPPGAGLINMTFVLGFDAAARPVVAYHRYGDNGQSQVYVARPRAAGGWQVRQVSDWNFRWAFSGGGSIAAEVRLGGLQREADGTLRLDYATTAAGAGAWRLDGDTLERVATLPAARPALAAAARRPGGTTPGLEVQTISATDGRQRWVLRWDTLGRNRDRPRDAAPPPSELRLVRVTGADPVEAFTPGSK